MRFLHKQHQLTEGKQGSENGWGLALTLLPTLLPPSCTPPAFAPALEVLQGDDQRKVLMDISAGDKVLVIGKAAALGVVQVLVKKKGGHLDILLANGKRSTTRSGVKNVLRLDDRDERVLEFDRALAAVELEPKHVHAEGVHDDPHCDDGPRDDRVLEKKLDELIALVGARESRALEAEHRILQLEEAVLRLQQQQQQQKRAAEAPAETPQDPMVGDLAPGRD